MNNQNEQLNQPANLQQPVKKAKSKRLILIIVAILVIGGVVGYYLVNNKILEKIQNKIFNTREEPSNINELANDIESWNLEGLKLTKEEGVYTFYVTIDGRPGELIMLSDSSDNIKSTVKPCDLLDGKSGLGKGVIQRAGTGKGELYRTYDNNVEVYFGSMRRGFDSPEYFWCNSAKTVLISVFISDELVNKYFQFYGLTQKEMTPSERDTKRKADIETLYLILGEYINENPLPTTDEIIKIDDPNTAINKELNKFIKENKLTSSFLIDSLPVDPLSPQYYYGLKVVNEKDISLILTAKLENTNDPECVIENQICLYKTTR
jgi:hypothetical protein